MIAASADAFDALAARLTARAEALARDRAEQVRRTARPGSHRWRSAEYLWPRFVKG